MSDSTIDSHRRHEDDTEKPSPETIAMDETVDDDDLLAQLEAFLGSEGVSGLIDISAPGPAETHEFVGQVTQELESAALAFLTDAEPSRAQFTPLDTLGEGGMGIVHLAAQEVPNRYVAIKTLKTYSSDGAKQIFAEAMLTGSLEHPNIIPVHAIHLDGDRGPEVVMKRVEGISMREAFDRAPPSEESLIEFLGALIKVCRALEYAHAQGVIHRDIKLDNIMLGQFGEVYLMDWGIAIDTRRVTEPLRGLVGTPHFMAPEMVSGDPEVVDERTDVYLLGATLHFLLSGRPRHDESKVMAALVKARLSRPYQYGSHVFPELGDLANRACERQPEARPPTVAVFREAIEECLKHWDAVKIMQRAQSHVDHLLSSTSSNLPLVDLVRHYEAATSGLESALLIWPDFSAANERLLRVRQAMLVVYAEADQPDMAHAVYEKLALEYPNEKTVLASLQGTIQGAAIRRKRISLQVAANDLAPSTTGRRRAAIAMVAVVVAICSVMGYLEYHRTTPRSAAANLLVWLVGCVAFWSIIFKDRKPFMANEAGRRVLIPLICGPAIVLIMRAGVYLRDLDPLQSMGGEILVLGFACATMAPAFPSGPKFGVVALCFAALAFSAQEFAYASFVGTCLVCSAGLAWEWIKKGRTFLDATTPSAPDDSLSDSL